MTASTPLHAWPKEGAARVPAWIYSDPALFRREMEVFHFGPTCNYVALECEIPSPGSFKRSWIATRPVIVVRDETGAVQVLENRCAHRGTMVCWTSKGTAKTLMTGEYTFSASRWNSGDICR